MKIAGVETVVVRGPRRSVYGKVHESALGPKQYSEHGIIFVSTDAGIMGAGEISTAFKKPGRLFCREVDLVLGPALIGEDPFRIAHLIKKMDALLDGSEEAKAGLEMALWDIMGKALETPIYNLLGGRVRDQIPLSYSVPFGEPEEMARFATERVQEGFKTIKVKVGCESRRDIETVRCVRQAIGPDIQLRIDANMAWRTPKEAIWMIEQVGPYHPQLIEQPLPRRDIEGMSFLRKQVAVPIMADESVWTPRDCMEVIKNEAADYINVYVSEAGGLMNASRIFAMCGSAGIPCIIGSMPEFGIGTAAAIHLGIAMSNLELDCDTCGVLYHAEDLLSAPLKICGGLAYPPSGPGLGVDINMDVVERWRISE